MGSLYLNALTAEQGRKLENDLYAAQHGKCFICEKPIDMVLHAKAIDIDHVEPLKTQQFRPDSRLVQSLEAGQRSEGSAGAGAVLPNS
jgi:hypothetical protein